MIRSALISLLVLVSFLQGLSGQEGVITFSGHFEEASFAEFAASVEAQIGTTFYYRASWVRDLRVSLSGRDLSLLAVLDSILEPTELNYYLDDWNHLFLSDSTMLIAGLPEYEGVKETTTSDEEDQEDSRERELTSAEQNYIDGRRVRVLEEIHVGSADRFQPGRNVLISGQIHDKESGESLVGVTIYMKAINKGASTAVDGRFNFLLAPGSYGVECQSMGMESLLFTLVVHSAGELELDMKRTLFPLDEVVVTAGRRANVSGNQMGYERLNYNVLKQVPLVMGERDI